MSIIIIKLLAAVKLMGLFSELIKKYLHLIRTLKQTDSLKIVRRYFLMNSFDACLATFSLLVANYIAGIANNYVVLILSITAGISMAISGFWGSIFVEHVEQQKQLKKLQNALQTNLEGTHLRGDYETSSLLLALVNGLSPIVVSIVIVSPFLLLESFYAYYVAFFVVVILLFILGFTMAKIGKTNSFYFILKFFSAAIFAVILIFLINHALNYII